MRSPSQPSKAEQLRAKYHNQLECFEGDETTSDCIEAFAARTR